MNNMRLNFAGTELSRLRTLVEAVERQIRLVEHRAAAGESASPKSALDMTWSKLVEMLDLGAEPAMQTCPHCHGQWMAGASRCGNCWGSLVAKAAPAAATAGAGHHHVGRRRAAG